jgi:hypothetical protein
VPVADVEHGERLINTDYLAALEALRHRPSHATGPGRNVENPLIAFQDEHFSQFLGEISTNPRGAAIKRGRVLRIMETSLVLMSVAVTISMFVSMPMLMVASAIVTVAVVMGVLMAMFVDIIVWVRIVFVTVIMNVRMAVAMLVTMLMLVIVLLVIMLVVVFIFFAHRFIVPSRQFDCSSKYPWRHEIFLPI